MHIFLERSRLGAYDVTMNDCEFTRKALGETQKQFAERLGVSQTTVSRWESGKLRMSTRDVLAIQTQMPQMEANEPK